MASIDCVSHVLHDEAVHDGPGCLAPALQQGHHPDPLGPTWNHPDQPQALFFEKCSEWSETSRNQVFEK